MTIQPISEASAVLFLTPADLHQRGLCADTLTAAGALTLVREALEGAGLALGGTLEIETYPDQCGLLLFVRGCHPPRAVWHFEDWEALLGAVSVLGGAETEGALYWWKERFWLLLPSQPAGIRARLSEFGSEETSDSYIDARLSEHGCPLLASDAPAALRRYFGSPSS